MTTLLLVQKKMINWSSAAPILWEQFTFWNRGGSISAVLITILSLAIAGYFISLYTIFQFGFILQENHVKIEQLSDVVLRQELILQKKIGFLESDSREIIKSLEKVSTVRFIPPSNMTAVLPSSRP